jgi:hypothetical protein
VSCTRVADAVQIVTVFGISFFWLFVERSRLYRYPFAALTTLITLKASIFLDE